jgi:uncharacterized repeat protein (TIGR03803 family)
MNMFRIVPRLLWLGPLAVQTLLGIFVGFSAVAVAQPVETVIHNFTNSPDGSLPNASVAISKGMVYGVTPFGARAGGFTGSGLVFGLTPPSGGRGSWTETLVHSFGANSGGVIPQGRLISDAQGALYGTTNEGGTNSCLCGTVFKLTPPSPPGKAWTRSTLYSFTGADGSAPEGGMTFGPEGVLYGTTYSGGAGNGVVFRLTPPAVGKTRWTEATLTLFSGETANGAVDAHPRGRLIIDKGVIYGTNTGGAYGGGTVFKLTPPAKGKTAWTETILFAFKSGKEGGDPEGGLIMDAAGDLYGMTEKGGIKNCPPNSAFIPNGCGVIFKLTPAGTGTLWKETILHSFRGGADGANPLGELAIDTKGNLYGTTSNGGVHGCTISGVLYGCGTIFKLAPPAAGHTVWLETQLYRFPEEMTSGRSYYPNGIEPLDGVAVDSKGNFYGTAYAGGVGGVGVVFELTNTGFVVR